MGEEENFSKFSNKLQNISRLLIRFRETNYVSITAVGVIDPSHWNAIIVALKSVFKHGGIEDVGIRSLLLRLMSWSPCIRKSNALYKNQK